MITEQYIAGLFDGEGSVSLQVKDNVPKLEVSIHMSEPASIVLMEINAKYRGKLYTQNRIHRGRSYRMFSARWTNRDEIDSILTVLIPYLIIKKEQAKLARWWVNNCLYKHQCAPWGLDKAREIIIADLKLMKQNPLMKAEDTIDSILNCFGSSYANILRLRGK